MIHRNGAGDSQVGGIINYILRRSRVLSGLQTAIGNRHILLRSPSQRMLFTTSVRFSRMIHTGQNYPLAGDCDLIASLNVVVDPRSNYFPLAEKNEETFRERLKKFVCHDPFIASNWHSDTSALDDDSWTIRLITKFVASPSKCYFAVQTKGIIPD